MQTEFLVIAALLAAVLVAQLLLLLRPSHTAGLEHSLREELRLGRSELREQLNEQAAGSDHQLDQLRRGSEESITLIIRSIPGAISSSNATASSGEDEDRL